jgi:hypothetical protein
MCHDIHSEFHEVGSAIQKYIGEGGKEEYSDTQHSDRISPFLFSQNKESRLK